MALQDSLTEEGGTLGQSDRARWNFKAICRGRWKKTLNNRKGGPAQSQHHHFTSASFGFTCPACESKPGLQTTGLKETVTGRVLRMSIVLENVIPVVETSHLGSHCCGGAARGLPSGCWGELSHHSVSDTVRT